MDTTDEPAEQGEPALAMAFEELPALFPMFAGAERWLPLLRRHGELVVAASERVRVTAVPIEEFPRRHYAECLELLRFCRRASEGQRFVDIGSGGGFPGLVFAIVEPASEVHLVEPLLKRARLMEEMSAELGLTNVTVHGERAEDAARGPLRESADIVTARAVAELRELLEYAAPFAARGGSLLFPKGSGLEEEIEAAAFAIRKLGCGDAAVARMRPAISDTLAVLSLRKIAKTPATYPRRAGVPHQRPL
jgi:16S rRNA (guanine527-N7)-methyltransferase